METLGHSQVSLTLDTYSHVLPGLQAEAAQRMHERLAVRLAVRTRAVLRQTLKKSQIL